MNKWLLVNAFSVLLLVLGLMNQAEAQPTLFGAAHTGGPGSPSTLYTINSGTGAASPVGPIGFSRCSGMDFHPFTQVLYAICEDVTGAEVLITINTATGGGTLIGPTGAFHQDISFRNSDGKLYGYSTGTITTISLGTGTAAFLPAGPPFNFGNGLAFSPSDVLFHSDNLDLNTVSIVTGGAITTTPHGYPGTLNDPRNNALDFEPGTGILFASTNDGSGGAGPNYLSTVDTSSAIVTVLGQTVNGLDAIAFLPEKTQVIGGTIIPIETTTLLLAGIQTSAIWIVPTILSAAGIGLVFLWRK